VANPGDGSAEKSEPRIRMNAAAMPP